jgi:predicted transcriptional regulator
MSNIKLPCEDRLMQIIKLSASISGLDHDIRNSLTIFSLSMRIIEKSANKYNDPKLLKICTQMQEGLDSIEKILTKLKPLKDNASIIEFKNKMDLK